MAAKIKECNKTCSDTILKNGENKTDGDSSHHTRFIIKAKAPGMGPNESVGLYDDEDQVYLRLRFAGNVE